MTSIYHMSVNLTERAYQWSVLSKKVITLNISAIYDAYRQPIWLLELKLGFK